MPLVHLPVLLGDVPNSDFESPGVGDDDASFGRVVPHARILHFNPGRAFSDAAAEQAIGAHGPDDWLLDAPLVLVIRQPDGSVLDAVVLHAQVGQCELVGARWEDVGWPWRQQHEGIHHGEADALLRYPLVARLKNPHADVRHAGLHASEKEKVRPVGRPRPRVWRGQLLHPVHAAGDGPVEAEAVQAAEEVALVVEACHLQMPVLVRAPLPVASVDPEAVDGADLRLASQHLAGI